MLKNATDHTAKQLYAAYVLDIPSAPDWRHIATETERNRWRRAAMRTTLINLLHPATLTLLQAVESCPSQRIEVNEQAVDWIHAGCPNV